MNDLIENIHSIHAFNSIWITDGMTRSGRQKAACSTPLELYSPIMLVAH